MVRQRPSGPTVVVLSEAFMITIGQCLYNYANKI